MSENIINRITEVYQISGLINNNYFTDSFSSNEDDLFIRHAVECFNKYLQQGNYEYLQLKSTTFVDTYEDDYRGTDIILAEVWKHE